VDGQGTKAHGRRTCCFTETKTAVISTIMQRTLVWIGIAALTVLTGLVLWAGVGMLMTMNESEKSQGGQFYVGVGLIVALAWLVGQFVIFAKRLRP
jgi:uncharacterized membrane protein YidH (DUF202 family)